MRGYDAHGWKYRPVGKQHWFADPDGNEFKLPQDEGRTNTDTVAIRGICGGKPVITVATQCHHSLDAGLDRTSLYWGDAQIETWTGAVVVREDGTAFVHVRGLDEDFEIVEHRANGDVTVLGRVGRNVCDWISALREVRGEIEYYVSSRRAFLPLNRA